MGSDPGGGLQPVLGAPLAKPRDMRDDATAVGGWPSFPSIVPRRAVRSASALAPGTFAMADYYACQPRARKPSGQ